MNKRMRKFLVSLGMVVVLGSGSVFANDTVTGITSASELKTLMNKADDYLAFARTVNVSVDFDGSIAANLANILNGSSQVGYTKNDGNNTSFIYKLSDDTRREPFRANHTVALDITQNKIVPVIKNNNEVSGYNLINSREEEIVLSQNKGELNLLKIGTNGLGTTSRPTGTNPELTDIDIELTNLELVQKRLAISQTSNQINVVNIPASTLQGSGSYDVQLVDSDNDGNTGVTVVNVVMPNNNEISLTKTITINGSNVGDYNKNVGKVLLNFVTGTLTDNKIENANSYTGRLNFGCGAGVLLAPRADVHILSGTGNGNFDGSVISNTFSHQGEVHQVEFNVTEKNDDNIGTDGNVVLDTFNNNNIVEAGDTLRYGAMAVVGLAGAGLAIVNRKGKDEE